MARGFVYWWRSSTGIRPKVLSWRLLNAIDTTFCVEALTEVVEMFDPPGDFRTDRGSTCTAQVFTQVMQDAEVKINMNGRGGEREQRHERPAAAVGEIWAGLLHVYDGGAAARIAALVAHHLKIAAGCPADGPIPISSRGAGLIWCF